MLQWTEFDMENTQYNNKGKKTVCQTISTSLMKLKYTS